MGTYKSLLLQVQSHLVIDLILVWNCVLIMGLLILGISFLQNFIPLLLDVLDLFNNVDVCSIREVFPQVSVLFVEIAKNRLSNFGKFTLLIN